MRAITHLKLFKIFSFQINKNAHVVRLKFIKIIALIQ